MGTWAATLRLVASKSASCGSAQRDSRSIVIIYYNKPTELHKKNTADSTSKMRFVEAGWVGDLHLRIPLGSFKRN